VIAGSPNFLSASAPNEIVWFGLGDDERAVRVSRRVGVVGELRHDRVAARVVGAVVEPAYVIATVARPAGAVVAVALLAEPSNVWVRLLNESVAAAFPTVNVCAADVVGR
jgi:hypothetical protein